MDTKNVCRNLLTLMFKSLLAAFNCGISVSSIPICTLSDGRYSTVVWVWLLIIRFLRRHIYSVCVMSSRYVGAAWTHSILVWSYIKCALIAPHRRESNKKQPTIQGSKTLFGDWSVSIFDLDHFLQHQTTKQKCDFQFHLPSLFSGLQFYLVKMILFMTTSMWLKATITAYTGLGQWLSESPEYWCVCFS